MPTEDEFALIFEAVGGRLIPAYKFQIDLLIRAKNTIESIRRNPKTRPSLPSIEIGLVNNSEINASACLTDKGAYIGINEGVIQVLFDLFSRMLAYRNLFTDIGNYTDECIEQPTLLFPSTNTRSLANQIKPYSLISPVDKLRASYAQDLFLIAFDFICSHELAHILYGHCSLLREQGFGLVMEEIEPTIPNDINFSQALEMDADSFVVSSLFGWKWKSLQDDKSRNRLFEQYVFQFSIATYSTLRLIGFGDNRSAASHPSPVSRRNLIGFNMTHWLQSNLEKDQADTAIASCAAGVKASEEAFTAIFGNSIPKDEIKKSFDDLHFAYNKQLVHKWREIYPDVQRLAFIERAGFPIEE